MAGALREKGLLFPFRVELGRFWGRAGAVVLGFAERRRISLVHAGLGHTGKVCSCPT